MWRVGGRRIGWCSQSSRTAATGYFTARLKNIS